MATVCVYVGVVVKQGESNIWWNYAPRCGGGLRFWEAGAKRGWGECWGQEMGGAALTPILFIDFAAVGLCLYGSNFWGAGL